MTPDFNAAQAYAFTLMARQLSPDLAYHGLHHTRDQVLPAVQLFCSDLDIPLDQQLHLATAAVFHDIGFIRQYEDNEIIGADWAASLLPDFGYSPADVAEICKLIMATRMPQQPENIGSQILCDADLVTLGEDMFFETSMMLRRETACFLESVPLRDWLAMQYEFLMKHRYFTTVARRRLNPGKEKNLADLQQLFSADGNRR